MKSESITTAVAAERAFEADLVRCINKHSQEGRRRKILTILAEALQRELTTHPSHCNGQHVPYYIGIENVMRAFIAVLNPDFVRDAAQPGIYISTNLRYVGVLAEELERDIPTFADNEVRYAVRLSTIDH